MTELKVHASACEDEFMVHSEELRTGFAKRLKKAMADANIADWGAGVRLAKITKTTPKAVSKWLNGETMPGRSNMQALADHLRVRVEWLEYGNGEQGLGVAEAPATYAVNEDGSPSETDYALIPQYFARASAGNGYHNDHVDVGEGLVFKRSWLARLKLKTDRLCAIYADGSSMEPTIYDGEVLLIDQSDVTPKNGKVYAILRPDGSVSIKRLVQQIAGSWIIRSDNPDKTRYPDEEISSEMLGHIEIIGRSVWRGGGM
jgi:phage repressor protein C with HTH and peptisase S24 domain